MFIHQGAARYSRWRTGAARTAMMVALVGLLGVVGCGSSGPATYTVRGKVELRDGDIKHLAGSHIEAALESDPTVRASGEIQPDGSFSLETLRAGTILKGTTEGTYQLRIIPTDEDKESRRRAIQALAPHYLQFQTSGLSLQVPPNGEVTVALARRPKQ